MSLKYTFGSDFDVLKYIKEIFKVPTSMYC